MKFILDAIHFRRGFTIARRQIPVRFLMRDVEKGIVGVARVQGLQVMRNCGYSLRNQFYVFATGCSFASSSRRRKIGASIVKNIFP